jgi:superfamily I DNA/RNA helicase
VDEGQDLDPEAFAMIRGLAPHVTVAMDHKQQIYDQGSGEVEIIRALGLRRSNLTLLDAFRCCPYIVRIAAEFIPDPAEREAFLNQGRTRQTEIQTPLLYEAADFDDEKARLIEVLRERQLVDRSIAILFPLKRQVEGFAQGLRAEGIPVETVKNDALDFSSPLPKLLTFHSAKGLTFDSVLMPRLVKNSFAGPMSKRTERLLYVGLTRATKWLYLSGTRGAMLSELDRTRSLADEHPPVITVQRERPLAVVPSQAGRTDDDSFNIF